MHVAVVNRKSSFLPSFPLKSFKPTIRLKQRENRGSYFAGFAAQKRVTPPPLPMESFFTERPRPQQSPPACVPHSLTPHSARYDPLPPLTPSPTVLDKLHPEQYKIKAFVVVPRPVLLESVASSRPETREKRVEDTVFQVNFRRRRKREEVSLTPYRLETVSLYAKTPSVLTPGRYPRSRRT